MEQDWHVGYTFIASPGQPPRRFESEKRGDRPTGPRKRADCEADTAAGYADDPAHREYSVTNVRHPSIRTNPIEAQPREREREDEDKKARQVSRHLSSAASRVTRARSSGSINCTTYSR
jgi:hypothetical protein